MEERKNNNISAQEYLKTYIQKKDLAFKNKLSHDGLPTDLKFGEFEFDIEDGHYKISQTFYINDEQNHKEEMIELSKLLNQFYKEKNNGIN
ncbi:hypothetical protein [Arcobacter sp. F2176]|uniref:hypothetical protein n=1 Tax=Arcobacter sp. F2176 TaxID=2044511 RepID=UPI00100A4BC7|nr:hypothetical protein [Arcobacter sp. F2176]RXJ80307.1 hypothetical protein CRU95_11520 [Arcobacter sp. F2176]